MKKSLKYIGILFATIFIVSCSESYLDVNTDKNSPTGDVLGPELVLPIAQYWSGEIVQRNRYTNNLGNMMVYNWSQSDGFSWYNDEFLYNVTSSFYQIIWTRSYRDALKQYRVLQSYGDQYDNYKAIGKIMESYHFQILVDLYGDIPYSEALQRGGNPTPAYDDAEAVYQGIVSELDMAMALIDGADGSDLVPGSDDIMFGGDMATWKKFANTVKLRVLVRQGSGDFTGMASVGFIDQEVTVQPGYAVVENQQNPFWNAFGADSGGTITNNNNATCATQFVLDYLDGTSDSRISYIYEEPATGHLGVVQGLQDYDVPIVDQFDPQFVSNIGPGILKGATMPAVIFTLADAYFLQAEAILNGDLTGDAKAAYESGIQSSFSYLGDPGFSDYISQPRALVAWDSSPNKLEAIITQKWIATNGIDAVQSWFDYTRTGYPSGLPISLLATTPERPVRLFYPASELTANAANVPPQPNAFNDKIFWAN
ncbi:SusD/RagB family nutrient-binding outer membrane lipoprotein [Algibacter marinivivus]|uniref:SusD/RagB family nutrient-binding outer membrane lipoprotein n=1 Tax=Algibacter marinivivus TaxID=2100723 RepID=A0A2U2X6I1_9FLAO|nr:SusD/RagB family nutrient-binding outer membrane lipoprotein [Algibacter marinivivus]PWH83407.1 SusD/RagB family nutrient-binding outer membrane lipoprotein [Algibacter marinivivus]